MIVHALKLYLLFFAGSGAFFSDPPELRRFLILSGTGMSEMELMAASWAGVLVLVRVLFLSNSSGSRFSLTAVTMFCSKKEAGRIVLPSSSMFFGIVTSGVSPFSSSLFCFDFLTDGMGMSVNDSIFPSCRGVFSWLINGFCFVTLWELISSLPESLPVSLSGHRSFQL